MKHTLGGRAIIVNADDLGLCASVNTAIFEVFRAGNLSSATLMVNMPGTYDAVQRLRDHLGLAVGLHFCITEGAALSGPSSLTDETGSFLGRFTLAARALRRQVKPADVRREFEAQLNKAEELGVRLTHTDSHQHTMMLPVVMDAIAPVAIQRGLAVRLVDPPVRTILRAWRRPEKFLKQLLNKRLSLRHREKHRLLANDALVSIHDLESAGPYSSGTYRSLLEDARDKPLTEVMVHPYILGDDLRALYVGNWADQLGFIQRCMAEAVGLNGAPVFDGYRMTEYTQP